MESLGTLKGYQAKIYTDHDATPQFFKVHSLHTICNKHLRYRIAFVCVCVYIYIVIVSVCYDKV